MASSGYQAQFVSTINGTSGPSASRAAATASTVRSCNFTFRYPRSCAVETMRRTVAGSCRRNRLAYASTLLFGVPPNICQTGLLFTLPRMSHIAISIPDRAKRASPPRIMF